MSNKGRRLTFICLQCVLFVAVVYAILAGAGRLQRVQAQSTFTTYTVTTTDNAGAGSLRRALHQANANPGADAVVFDIAGCAPTTPCVISLLNPLPVITDAVAITGTGMRSLVVDASSNFRVLEADDVAVSIARLTAQNGFTAGSGAGIRSSGALTLTRVRLINNIAWADGGGAYAAEGLTVVDSHVEHNSSLESGGGLYTEAHLFLENTDLISNTAVSHGGGAFGLGAATVRDGRFERNHSDDEGGGLWASDTVVLTATLFLSNTASSSGGGLATWMASVSQAWFERNFADLDGGGMHASDVSLANTTFLSNTATGSGGGLAGFGAMQLVDTSFTGNVALLGDGGGLSMPSPIPAFGSPGVTAPQGLGQSLVMSRTHFTANTAGDLGGGMAIFSPFVMRSSSFVGNAAELGGAVYHEYGDGFVVNSLFAANTANSIAAALALDSGGDVEIQHATIAGADGISNSASAIGLTSGSLTMGNTILTQHATGIRNDNGTLVQDYNLFYQNGLDIDGDYSGGVHSLDGDPQFVAPESNDYHLGAGSAALDMGTDAGILEDFEGDPRPVGPGFDIGFDEADLLVPPTQTSYLPVFVR